MPTDLTDLLMRAAGLGVGLVIFVHFAAMAASCEGRSVPLLDALLIPCVAATGVGLVYTVATQPPSALAPALMMCCLALAAFVLRIWWLGFYVSHFLQGRGK